jgi:endonuclease YncB( thermonuclease family)
MAGMQTPAMALRWLSLLLVLAALPQGAGSAQALKGEVLSIGDGDTIRVRQDGRAITVRLACIDAPEMAQRPYGQQARSYLQQRLPVGREVNLDVKTTDRYGRTVAEVFSGLSINLALVEDGQAFAYRQYLGSCNAQEYLDAEHRASRRRVGVWQVPGGITRPGTSAVVAVQQRFPMAPLPADAGIAATRSAPMPVPRSCCARGTPISTAMVMGKRASRCVDRACPLPQSLLSNAPKEQETPGPRNRARAIKARKSHL